MGYRKVGCLEQLWYVLRWKLFRRRRMVCDFEYCVGLAELKDTLYLINRNRYILIGVTQSHDTYTVFFRRREGG